MPHQNVEAGKATAQNAATDPISPRSGGAEPNAVVKPEPASYAAPDVSDSSLAPPGAGEVADYMDEGEPLDGEEVHSGRDRTNVAAHSRDDEHGSKTRAAIQKQIKGG